MKSIDDEVAATVDQWLESAMACIDQRLGSGYAAAHPVLVGAFVGACARHAAGLRLGLVLAPAVDGVGTSLAAVAGAISDHE